MSRTRDAVRKRSRSRLMRFDAIERLMTVRREMAEERAAEERRWLEAEQADERLRGGRGERRAAEQAAGWQPVPVPLPTYVSKPMAPRRAPADRPDPARCVERGAGRRGQHGAADARQSGAGPVRPARAAPGAGRRCRHCSTTRPTPRTSSTRSSRPAPSTTERPGRGRDRRPRSGRPRLFGSLAVSTRGCSAAGSAPRSQRGGQGFESPQLHHSVVDDQALPRDRGGASSCRSSSYLPCRRLTISVIQIGANGEVQFGGVG